MKVITHRWKGIMIEDFDEFCEKMRREDFDLLVEIGRGLGIVSYSKAGDVISWKDFPDKADGKIKPLSAGGDFWYYIEFADHSLSVDHIQTSIHEARELGIKVADSKGYQWEPNRKRLLIICQHNEDAADLRTKINDFFPHDTPEQSDNPLAFVIRWSDVVTAHNKKKLCYCGNGKEKIKNCINNYCEDCCWQNCMTYRIGSRMACPNATEALQRKDDFIHRHADGWK